MTTKQASTATYYAILGVAPNADTEVIRRAWRAQVVRLHPDRMPRAGERLRLVNHAWAILKDPQKRAAYDAALLTSPAGKGLAAVRRAAKAKKTRGKLRSFLREILWPFTSPAEARHGR